MIRSLWTAATGMAAQQLNIDVISNNLANVNTSGFKKSRVDFQDLLYQTLRPAGIAEAQGAQVPTGSPGRTAARGPAAVSRIFTQGDFQQTENPLDLVIEGDGFFQVLMPDGSVRLHARRHVQARRPGTHDDLGRLSARPRDQHPGRGHEHLGRR